MKNTETKFEKAEKFLLNLARTRSGAMDISTFFISAASKSKIIEAYETLK
jgi:hypothetical protein